MCRKDLRIRSFPYRAKRMTDAKETLNFDVGMSHLHLRPENKRWMAHGRSNISAVATQKGTKGVTLPAVVASRKCFWRLSRDCYHGIFTSTLPNLRNSTRPLRRQRIWI